MFFDQFDLFIREKILKSLVADDRETRFFVRNFCAERIRHKNSSVAVSVGKRIVFVEFVLKFVDQNALVKNINFKIADAQNFAVIFQIARIGKSKFYFPPTQNNRAKFQTR